ncbi:hypothetical protein [Haladaptatus pallidirubidus]|uniref:Uncharacterized protein n=2 Tax=Haladaptatus pallidirubidus TaxID=1008152 RepID=A0AAV3UH40_9EURY
MGEHEDRSVELRSLTPVALERILSPQALLVAEHPPAHHVGAGTFYRLREEFVVAISLAAFLTVHLAEASQVEQPLVEPLAVITQRVLGIIVRSDDVPIE